MSYRVPEGGTISFPVIASRSSGTTAVGQSIKSAPNSWPQPKVDTDNAEARFPPGLGKQQFARTSSLSPLRAAKLAIVPEDRSFTDEAQSEAASFRNWNNPRTPDRPPSSNNVRLPDPPNRWPLAGNSSRALKASLSSSADELTKPTSPRLLNSLSSFRKSAPALLEDASKLTNPWPDRIASPSAEKTGARPRPLNAFQQDEPQRPTSSWGMQPPTLRPTSSGAIGFDDLSQQAAVPSFTPPAATIKALKAVQFNGRTGLPPPLTPPKTPSGLNPPPPAWTSQRDLGSLVLLRSISDQMPSERPKRPEEGEDDDEEGMELYSRPMIITAPPPKNAPPPINTSSLPSINGGPAPAAAAEPMPVTTRKECAQGPGCLNFFCAALHPDGQIYLNGWEGIMQPAELLPPGEEWFDDELRPVFSTSAKELAAERETGLGLTPPWDKKVVETTNNLHARLVNMAQTSGDGWRERHLMNTAMWAARAMVEAMVRAVYAKETATTQSWAPVPGSTAHLIRYLLEDADRPAQLVAKPCEVLLHYSSLYSTTMGAGAGAVLKKQGAAIDSKAPPAEYLLSDGNNAAIMARYSVHLAKKYNDWMQGIGHLEIEDSEEELEWETQIDAELAARAKAAEEAAARGASHPSRRQW